jgi:heme-degrading monooxygenase HmoA
MHARSGRLQVPPDQIDAALAALKEQMRYYRDAKGFVRFTAMADRKTGKILGISFWETEADREASEDLGARTRSSVHAAASGRGEIVRGTWEVVLEERA